VSILIPVYNSQRFLAECLDSVLAQDFPEVEILIADDGSTDASLEIIQRYAAKDRRIRWWQNPRNLGQTRNHNACLEAARGEFIKFVHQDDKLLSASAIQKMVAALADNPAAKLAGSASEVIDDQSRLQERRDSFEGGVWDGKQIIVAGLEATANRIGEPSVVMFRKADAGRGFLNDYQQLWDLEMWYHLLEQGDFVYLAEPLCAFRQHPAQQTNVNRLAGIGPNEMLLLIETYYARPWLRAIATQRMLINQARFLKKNRSKLSHRAELLRAEIKTQIKPASYPIYWLERRVLRLQAKAKKVLAWLSKPRSQSPAQTVLGASNR
jgi:glycosyltransferase involved in cell wall biosynthesis